MQNTTNYVLLVIISSKNQDTNINNVIKSNTYHIHHHHFHFHQFQLQLFCLRHHRGIHSAIFLIHISIQDTLQVELSSDESESRDRLLILRGMLVNLVMKQTSIEIWATMEDVKWPHLYSLSLLVVGMQIQSCGSNNMHGLQFHGIWFQFGSSGDEGNGANWWVHNSHEWTQPFAGKAGKFFDHTYFVLTVPGITNYSTYLK